jgi:DNA sulfur modification protein DndB
MLGSQFEYVFPAIRGIQAGREFYVSQCPLRLIPKLFIFDEPDVPAEVRAQRSLNRARLPEIAQYILDNSDDYVFSALTASIDAEVQFEPLGKDGSQSQVGLLHVPMSAHFVINDGQHRRGAIELALTERPSLGDETIAIVFFMDLGLARCQQMFADLNRYAVRPSSSISVLYDHRDPRAAVTRATVQRLPLLRDLVDFERTNLAKRSRKLFTLSAVFTAISALLADTDDLDQAGKVETAAAFWEGIAEGFPEWHLVHQRKLTAGEVRSDFIHSHGIVLHALGRAGHALLAASRSDWKQVGAKLGELDWSRANATVWEGRAMIGGRVSKAAHNVILTTNFIKRHLDVPLTPEEQRVEDAYKRGEYDHD